MTAILRLGGRTQPREASWTPPALAAVLFGLAASGLASAASGQAVDSATPNVLASPAPSLDFPLKHMPLSSLKATRERPLFSPSRRPAEAPVAQPPPSAAPEPPPPPAQEASRPNLTLVGTVTGGKRNLAIFTDAATQDTIRMYVGEARDGWTLNAIDRRAATLTKNDQAFTFEFPAAVDAPQAPDAAADDDDTPTTAWQARHQAQAAANGATPLRPPPRGAETQVQPPPPPPTPRRRSHP